MGMDEGMMQRHMSPIPAEYADLTNPVPADEESLARGETLYAAKCALCHGEHGWGDGPAAAGLDPPPAPIAHTAQMLSDAYLFYRLSEGGTFAPFNSAMPAWRETLNETERWDLVNYMRTLGRDGMMGGDGMQGGTPMDGGMMWWMMAPWLILGLVLVTGVGVAIVLAVVWAIRPSQKSTQSSETPLDILKRRYAQGEITSDQFEQMKRQLEAK